MLLPGPVELPCPTGVTGAQCNRADAVNDVVRRFGPEASRTVAVLQLLCGGSFESSEDGVTQSCTRYIRENVMVRAAAGHMHLLGKSIHIEVNAGTPRADAARHPRVGLRQPVRAATVQALVAAHRRHRDRQLHP